MPHYAVVTELERLDRLRLIRSARIGTITYHQLMRRFGHASAALAAVPQLGRKGGAGQVKLMDRDAALAELERLDRLGGKLVTYGEPDYPPLLMEIWDDAPPALSVLGRLELLSRDMGAIVGARNASTNGRKLAREMAADMGKAGFIVVSGLARGIDRAAHEGALATGTVAVMAGGVDVPYPDQNRDIYERIREQGAVVSEMALGNRPTARHFPPRNRIVSGLGLGVVVVEAARRSGSQITARMANEQGRVVMCVPGSPLDPRARGPNRLIREGATLVQDGAEIVEALQPLTRRPPGGAEASAPEPDAQEQGLDPGVLDGPEMSQARRRVADCLSPNGLMIDEIVRECGLTPALVHAVLLELELAGRIERQPGGRVAAI